MFFASFAVTMILRFDLPTITINNQNLNIDDDSQEISICVLLVHQSDVSCRESGQRHQVRRLLM